MCWITADLAGTTEAPKTNFKPPLRKQTGSSAYLTPTGLFQSCQPTESPLLFVDTWGSQTLCSNKNHELLLLRGPSHISDCRRIAAPSWETADYPPGNTSLPLSSHCATSRWFCFQILTTQRRAISAHHDELHGAREQWGFVDTGADAGRYRERSPRNEVEKEKERDGRPRSRGPTVRVEARLRLGHERFQSWRPHVSRQHTTPIRLQ